MKKFFSVLAVLTCLGTGAFAEVLLDANFTVPMGVAFMSDLEDGKANLSTVGIGAAFGATFIGEESKVGFGMKLGLDFPLSATLEEESVVEVSDYLGTKTERVKTKTKIDGNGVSVDGVSFQVPDYKYKTFGISSLLGVAIRPVNTGRFSLFVTPGLVLDYNMVGFESGSIEALYHPIHVGLGVDVAGLYHFTDMIYAKFALNGSLGCTGLLVTDGGSGAEAYLGFGMTFRPELGVGIKL